ncbi:tetratricopeptide repeat protein [Parasphingorhabdus sp.]|uniref:tetratricopeptide repeat protein n=1 Tax=Parasphingorhabdus sp. TaxID=2709688 RepID=UPI003001CC63
MKTAKIIGIAAGILLTATPAMAQDSGEIGYAKGALGYDALVAGENELALQQLEATDKVDANDPARLINLGQVYARMGRNGDAARMFMAAMKSDRNFDLVLADGSVVSSRDAADQALQNLNSQFAVR